MIELDFQRTAVGVLRSECIRSVDFPNVLHIQRSSNDDEIRWVQETASAALSSGQ